MAKQSNVFSQGGGGVSYEIEVQTCFFISFLLGVPLPGLSGRPITFRQQSGSLGYLTDDLFLTVSAQRDIRVLIQIKHHLTISANGQEFKEVLSNAWKDFKNTELFDRTCDRIFIIKSDLTLDEKKHLVTLLNWARAKTETQDLLVEVNRISAKKHYWEMVKGILSACFPEDTLHEREIHDFLKVLYFMEYDLGNDASLLRSSYLSLISKYKAQSEWDEMQIWRQLYVKLAEGNYKGAIFTQGRGDEETDRLFHPNESTLDVRRVHGLSDQHLEILSLTENKIGGYSVNRSQLSVDLEECMERSSIVVISGRPGHGKSALAHNYLSSIKSRNGGLILSFRADELAEGSLADYFTKHSIKGSLKSIFSLFANFSHNVIYIDALEKLLEADGAAFSQLLALAAQLPKLKILISCRKASLPLLEMKYLSGRGHTILDIGAFGEEEIQELVSKLPSLKPLVENPRIRSLLKVPKYLDFASRAISGDYIFAADIDEQAFKESLWASIVENRLNGFSSGLAERRSRLFIELAVKRSKLMKPFVEIDGSDPEAKEKLLKDNVILQLSGGQLFTPSHDILEDWALVRHIEGLFNANKNATAFFGTLDTQPAMRRAYRLWVETVLDRKETPKIKFITDIALSDQLPGYWSDECLLAIMQSGYARDFCGEQSRDFSENNFALLLRAIKLVRTACRENVGDSLEPYYMPTGIAWLELIKIIFTHREAFCKFDYEVPLAFLKEWSNIFEDGGKLPEGTREAGLIMLHLMENYIEIGRGRRADGDEETRVLLRFAGGITAEIMAILDLKEEDHDEDMFEGELLRSKIMKISLTGLPSCQMARYLPETVIALAKKCWMKTVCSVYYPTGEHEQILHSLSRGARSTDMDSHFGLKQQYGDLQYLPASAIQTPTYWLLKYNTRIALQFIIDISNWCASSYASDSFGERDEVELYHLYLKGVGEVKQYGSDLLWSVYRGSVKVSPYAWQSILMALEKYLLEQCEIGISQLEKVDEIIGCLLEHSNSVAITGVVSSIYQAFPQFAKNYIAFLYSERKFLSYDISRWTHEKEELTRLALNPIHDQERAKSNKFYNRRRYHAGLQGFIGYYCFNHGEANEELFAVIDKHRSAATEDELIWRKRLDEMDIRTYHVTGRYKDGEQEGLLIEPDYAADLKDTVAELQSEQERIEKESGDAMWLIQVDNGAFAADIDRWERIWKQYRRLKDIDFIRHKPGVLARIGITFLWEQLSVAQKDWCIALVLHLVVPKVESAYDRFSMDFSGSSIELEAAVKVLPVLIGKGDFAMQVELEKILLYFLTAPFQRNDLALADLCDSISLHLWELNPAVANKCFAAVIRYGKFFKENRKHLVNGSFDGDSPEFEKRYEAFIAHALNDEQPLAIAEINFKEFSIDFLERAIKLVPGELPGPEMLEAMKKFTSLVTSHREDNRKVHREERIDYLRLALKEKMGQCALYSKGDLQASLMDFILGSCFAVSKIKTKDNYLELWPQVKLYREIVEQIILKTDDEVYKLPTEKAALVIAQFINCWRAFIKFLASNNTAMLADLLLLDISSGWKKTARNWSPIAENTDFFISLLKIFGPASIQAVVTLLARIGEETLFCEGFRWLAGHLKQTSQLEAIISLKDVELLISKGYDYHLHEIMEDDSLLADYLSVLEILIRNGSTTAYWKREYLISFKPSIN